MDVVHQRGSQDRRLSQFERICPPPKDAIDRRQIVATDPAIRISVMKTVCIRPQTQVVVLIKLMIEAQECHPACVVTNEYSRSDGRSYGRASILAAVLAGKEKMGAIARAGDGA